MRMRRNAAGGRKKRIWAVAAVSFVIIAVVAACIWGTAQTGKSIRAGKTGIYPNIAASGDDGDGKIVRYKGKTYEYEDNNINILCAGIDSRGADSNAGQADMLVLLVVNPVAGEIKCIDINRDTIAPVKVFGVAHKYITTQDIQVALSFAYGRNPAEGRELVSDSVSQLFRGIPVHACVSLDFDGIGVLNSIAGGVTVTAIQNVEKAGIAAGETVTLTDDQAVCYVTERDSKSGEVGTNAPRMTRQRQYILGLSDRLGEKIRNTPWKIIGMYEQMSPYISTDLTKTQMVYLAWKYSRYGLSQEDIYELPGVYDRTGYYDEYIVDDEKMTDMILNIFYREVK